MVDCYIVFEQYEDVYCENTISYIENDIKKNKTCGKRINCSQMIKYVTLDINKAISETRDKPTWGYKTEKLVEPNIQKINIVEFE